MSVPHRLPPEPEAAGTEQAEPSPDTASELEPEVDGPSAANIETTIVFQVAAALVAQPPTEITVVGVESKKGIVTLTGDVPSRALRAQAGEIASVHPDVESAVNDLRIRPSDDTVSDEEQKTEGTQDSGEHPPKQS